MRINKNPFKTLEDPGIERRMGRDPLTVLLMYETTYLRKEKEKELT